MEKNFERPPVSEEEKITKFKEKLKEIRSKYDIFEFSDAIVDFINVLREKYTDLEGYTLFHILIGSSINPEKKVEGFDFPSEDSIEKFINDFLEKKREAKKE